MKAVWLKEAKEDLLAFKAYMADKNAKAAKRIISDVLKTVSLLEDNPLMGSVGDIFDTRVFSVPDTPLKIIYTVSDETLFILFVPHHKQKWRY